MIMEIYNLVVFPSSHLSLMWQKCQLIWVELTWEHFVLIVQNYCPFITNCNLHVSVVNYWLVTLFNCRSTWSWKKILDCPKNLIFIPIHGQPFCRKIASHSQEWDRQSHLGYIHSNERSSWHWDFYFCFHSMPTQLKSTINICR